MDFCIVHVMVLEKAGVSVTLLLRGPSDLRLRPPYTHTVVIFGPGVLCELQVLIEPFLLLGKLSSLLHAHHSPSASPH